MGSMDKVMRIEPLEASFGARVTGIDLQHLDASGFSRLYDLWLEYALLIFPGQHLSKPAQVAFARRFGEPEFELAPLSNVLPDGTVRPADGSDDVMKVLQGNMGWHADSTYMPVQAKGAVFTAHVVPESGGETGWADMRAAYDALSDEVRQQLDGLSACHSLVYSQAKVGHAPRAGSQYSGYGFHDGDPPRRPLVKVHPETGRRSLLIGRHAYAVDGLSEAHSERLLDELLEFACQPPRVYHHRWQVGDAVVWDNRCLLHRAMPWDLTRPRVMYHSRIAGDPVSEAALPG